jgi:diphthamide synthase (EF-2-diphthine--ammonia ligase)
MGRAMAEFRSRGIHTIGFGDLFLEDLRDWREANLAKAGMKAVFPIWKRDTALLARRMIAMGFKAVLTCVEAKLGHRFAGRDFDAALLGDLPQGIDPCGERGEFHTFVHAAPCFSTPIPTRPGPIAQRDGRYYADLLLQGDGAQ